MVVDGMVKIPAGALEMGGDNAQADPNEFPKHKVVIDEFWMDETEVTNSAFAAFLPIVCCNLEPSFFNQLANLFPSEIQAFGGNGQKEPIGNIPKVHKVILSIKWIIP